MSFYIKTRSKKLLADTITPVGIFMRIREQYKNSIILESADYHTIQNSTSFIACDEVAQFCIDKNTATIKYPDGSVLQKTLAQRTEAVAMLQDFIADFKTETDALNNGLFGHISYDSVSYFEDIAIQPQTEENSIPQIIYRVYKYVIIFNHYKNELTLHEHHYSKDPDAAMPSENGLDQLEFFVNSPKSRSGKFALQGEETSNLDDDTMRGIINQCIGHCLRGDVFQIVPSRRFERSYLGDVFSVYRSLRSINPSPYLFFFDFEDYQIFGSSPEKQIGIQNGHAEIHPIAGTFRRTGDDEKDAELAKKLVEDPKESAEHVMLVDLARNDLSRSSENVQVEIFKEVQFYSHVIHLVSKVTGQMHSNTNPLQLVADTFPAGTLSGAPKHMAMSIINKLEPTNRGIYGGAIGMIDFKCNFNHAIAIRTFIAKKNKLFYQAGMGVVAKSDVDLEMAEVNNKLGALRAALAKAEELG